MTDEFESYFDVNKTIREATERIAEQTESALRDAVAAELRKQGWTVVPPLDRRTKTDNEKLAERLREAAKRAGYFQTGEQGLLNRAAEVIDALSAHTPTDDEREALAKTIYLWDVAESVGSLSWEALAESQRDVWREAADFVSAAGFRRTEVPEHPAISEVKSMPIEAIREHVAHRRSEVPEPSDESVPCHECGEPRPFGLDFMCLDCNGVRYVSENDWYAHHGCGFEEEWKYQWEAREAVDAHRASCDWRSEPQGEPSDSAKSADSSGV